MSDPGRDAHVLALNKDVNRSVDHRRKLLQSLYATTISFLRFKTPTFHEDGVGSFLDANDITRGRFFNASTLPGANLPEYTTCRSLSLQRDSDLSHRHTRDAAFERDVSDKNADDARNGAPTVQDSSNQAFAARSTRSAARNSKGQEEDECAASEPVPTKRAADQALGENTFPNAGTLTDVERSGGSLGRPSGALPEENPILEDIHAAVVNDAEQPDTVEYKDHAEGHRSAQGKNDLTPPDSGRIVHGDNANRKGRETASADIPKATTGQAGAESFVETPATPGEQLRNEEAQSRGRQITHPSSDLPSQFLHGTIDEGDPMVDVSTLHSEADVDQQALTRGHIDAENEPSARPTSGLRNHMVPGMNGEASRDLTFSRRPPMRIDTGVPSASATSSIPPQSKTAPATASSSQAPTPSRSTHPISSAQSPPGQRMTTRVSSGAMRHKSVSEILGETPKNTQAHADKANANAQNEDSTLQTPKSASSFVSPDNAVFRQRLNEISQKDRNSKLSTVVFAKQQPANVSRSSEVAESNPEVPKVAIKDRDYLLTWLVAQVYTPSPTHPVDRKPLNSLLKQAHKTLTTSDHYIDFHERQDCRILSKIQELQLKLRWSLRQPARSQEPDRPVAHWDILLGQVKWMRTDFREERKWKEAGARYLAETCAQWVASTSEERKILQVKAKATIPTAASRSDSELHSAPTPDLVHSMEDDSEAMDEDFPNPPHGEPPAAIFSLPPDMFIFGLNKSPVSEKILHELPLYHPNAQVENGPLPVATSLPDASWRLPLVPTSKYAKGKIISREDGPPRKRSRYSYSDNGRPCAITECDDSENVRMILDPENGDVALFNPEHKHIRDRIHTGHAFRPPSEHNMPSQSFFECRAPSQWTYAEDDELRKLVREYAYNWSLVSSCLSPTSVFSSGAERRTPWECFERWVSLEGLPAEMSKINYFKAYHQRLQAAARSYEAQQTALMQQHGNNQLPRRRSTQPFTVDRRKNNKHIHLIDAMRKQAKKRETKLLKDQHIATAASLRKVAEPQKARQTMHTPQEFSRMKYESQAKREEQVKAARMQYMAQQHQRQVALAQRANGQHPTQQFPPPRNLAPGAPNGSSPNMGAAMPHPRAGVASGGPQMQRPMNGQTNGVLPANAQGAPHAPVQAQMPMPMPIGQRLNPAMDPEQMRMYQASRIQREQQARIAQQQQHQQHPPFAGQGGSPNIQNQNSLPQNNPNMLASMEGRSSPALNGTHQPSGPSASPNMAQPQALSSGLTPAVNQISSQIKLRNPQASPEQIMRATTEQLNRHAAGHQAMQAAMGNSNTGAVGNNGNMNGMGIPSPMQQQAMMAGGANGGSPMLNAQQYNHMMREQQRSQQMQQRSGSVGSAQAVNGNSRGATPMNNRSGSAQGGRGLSQSPRAGQVGVAGVQ